jgi:predicted HTH transcriptional regulator
MFFRINYIEQMGTGIRRMRNAAHDANVAEPEFEFTGFFKVTFKRREPDSSTGHQSVANRAQSVAITDRKQAIISFLERNSQAKVSDFISIIGLSDGRVRALLREMVSDGTIEKVGQNRYAYYVLKQ